MREQGLFSNYRINKSSLALGVLRFFPQAKKENGNTVCVQEAKNRETKKEKNKSRVMNGFWSCRPTYVSGEQQRGTSC
jgi:hypothetical protein